MTALGWKADTRPGRVTALTNTRQSDALNWPDLDGSYRPEAVGRHGYNPLAQIGQKRSGNTVAPGSGILRR